MVLFFTPRVIVLNTTLKSVEDFTGAELVAMGKKNNGSYSTVVYAIGYRIQDIDYTLRDIKQNGAQVGQHLMEGISREDMPTSTSKGLAEEKLTELRKLKTTIINTTLNQSIPTAELTILPVQDVFQTFEMV